MSRRSRPARLDDVTRADGVHVSTVSRVINRSGDVAVRPETRQRILDVARELQYRANAMARGLRLVTTGTLGLLVPSLSNPVNSPIIRGAFDRAWARNFVLVLAEDTSESEDAPDAHARLVEERRIDGVLIQSARLGNPECRVVCIRARPLHLHGPLSSGQRSQRLHARRGSRPHGGGSLRGARAPLARPSRRPVDLDTVVRRCGGFVGRAREAGIHPVVLPQG